MRPTDRIGPSSSWFVATGPSVVSPFMGRKIEPFAAPGKDGTMCSPVRRANSAASERFSVSYAAPVRI